MEIESEIERERQNNEMDGGRLQSSCLGFERERVKCERIWRGPRKGESGESEGMWILCRKCERRCFSRAGLIRYQRSHRIPLV